VVEKPISIIAKLFGVWDQDIDATSRKFRKLCTTYDGFFKHVQEVIIDQITSLIARSADSINLFVAQDEVRTRIMELAQIERKVSRWAK
jgi:hypothetical protein